jgi:hypothetical protein
MGISEHGANASKRLLKQTAPKNRFSPFVTHISMRNFRKRKIVQIGSTEMGTGQELKNFRHAQHEPPRSKRATFCALPLWISPNNGEGTIPATGSSIKFFFETLQKAGGDFSWFILQWTNMPSSGFNKT